jgi:DNA-binding transcriptional MerR regulator
MPVDCYYNAMTERKYTIDELTEKTGFSRRTIRYYVQEGLIEPPAGRGRGGFYNDSHLAMLLRIRAQQDLGFSLSRIADLNRSIGTKMAETVPAAQPWVRYQVAPGVELHVSREVEQKEARRVLDLLRAARSIMKEDMDEVNG